MIRSWIFSPAQKAIALLALSIVVLFNITFFTKLFTFAQAEHDMFMLLSSPFIMFLLLICLLNLLFLLTNGIGFRLLIVVLLVASTLSSYFIDTFGTVIDKDMFINALQTDTHEVLDLLTLRLSIRLVIVALVSYWVLFKAPIRFQSYLKEFLQKLGVIVVSLVLVIGTYMAVSKTYSSFFRNHNELKLYLNPYFPLTSLGKLAYAKLKPKPTFKAIAEDAKRVEGDRKKLVVFVVGETARAANFALDGYDQPTTPLLSKRSDIVSFSNFYSCGTATAISVPCMFSKFGHDDWGSDKEYYENLVDVLAKTGVRIIWRDNNSGGDKDVAKRIQDVQQFGGQSFDDVLLKDFQSTIDQNLTDTFIVLHQEGSHGPTYFKRYPDSFKRFTPTCDTQDLQKCTQEQIVNTYNNTILYTDYIVNQTIALLKANETHYDTALIYVSDHGESLGENGIYLHGLPYLLAPDTQKHVPAVMYVGKGWQSHLESLKQKSSERFSHDNLFHTILGLFNVETKEYQPKLDLLH